MPGAVIGLKMIVEAVDRASGKLGSLKSRIDGAFASTKRLAAGGQTIGQKGAAGVERFNAALIKTKASMDRLNAAGDKMIGMGTQLSFIGAGLAGAAIFPTTRAADFEMAMNRVSAVTQGIISSSLFSS